MPRLQSVVDRVLTPRSPSLSNSDVSHPESSRLVELQRSGERRPGGGQLSVGVAAQVS